MADAPTQKQGNPVKRLPWKFRNRKKAPVVPKKPNNYAFIDSQNLNLGVQKMGWKMDWHKFREWLATEHGVTKAYMFIGYMQVNESLYEQMYDHGFLVVLKPTTEIKSTVSENVKGKGMQDVEKTTVKGNIDADLVLYAMKELPNYDKAVIVSGDGDFFALVEYLAEQNKLHKILTPNQRFSMLLQAFQKYIVDLSDHKKELAYAQFRRPNHRRSNKPS